MFEVINSLREEMEKVPVRVSQKCIDNGANSGLETVLSELPEELLNMYYMKCWIV